MKESDQRLDLAGGTGGRHKTRIVYYVQLLYYISWQFIHVNSITVNLKPAMEDGRRGGVISFNVYSVRI